MLVKTTACFLRQSVKAVGYHAPVGCCSSWSSKLHGNRGMCHAGVVLVTASCDVMLSFAARRRSEALACHRPVSAANVSVGDKST